jgi:hypothetical protein
MVLPGSRIARPDPGGGRDAPANRICIRILVRPVTRMSGGGLRGSETPPPRSLPRYAPRGDLGGPLGPPGAWPVASPA